jgi:hypothetical protein
MPIRARAWRVLHAMRRPRLAARFVLALALGAAAPGFAQDPVEEPEERGTGKPIEEIVIKGRADSQVGVADTASQGTIGAEQLERRPLARPGEVLETVPGLIATQHSGAGKANQYFLRGFNLDHGTDFATFIDGVPVNLPSHGHGQGYTDLNFLIPELIERLNYRKGVYYPELGDFSSAGAAKIEYFDRLPQDVLLQAEAGMYDYGRGLAMGSQEIGPGVALGALEIFHDNGPWEHEDNFWNGNAVLKYSGGDNSMGYSLTTSAYAGDWDATDQIARRALNLPGFGRFDSLNKTSGGDSQKYMLYGEWHRGDDSSATNVLLYGFYQHLKLYSNFTYYLSSPDGDEFEQKDERWVGGGSASQTWFNELFERQMRNTIGVQLRSDSIENGLFQTVRRHRVDKPDWEGGAIPSTTRKDDIWELSLAPYIENQIQWHEKVRTLIGGRLDYYHFDVEGVVDTDTGKDDDVIASPKGNLILGPWYDTELYLSAGMGFHSNDARGVTASEDAADPLVRSYGAEVGVRTSWVPGLQSTAAVWWLDLDSELVFVGDAGETAATRPSRRYGVELANYYSPLDWLTFDVDYAWSHTRFRDHEPEGDYIPGSVENVVGAGVTVHDIWGLIASLRLRYFGPRPLTEDDDERSHETILLGGMLAYDITPSWRITGEVFNLLDRDDAEIDYFYASCLQNEVPPNGTCPADGGIEDIQFHPVYPITFRGTITARF